MKKTLNRLFNIKDRQKKYKVAPLPYPYPHKGFWIAAWFGSGHLPLSGTAGTVASLPFIWLIYTFLGVWPLVLFTVLSLVVGVWACRVVEEHTGAHDHKSVVIDEVFGMAMVICIFPLFGLGEAWHWLLAFVLFRFFDMVKPPPISWMDSKFEGPWGVMLDDGVAALFAIAVLWFMFG
jgi:phosphatidylglycerophosphatase A